MPGRAIPAGDVAGIGITSCIDEPASYVDIRAGNCNCVNRAV